MRLSDLYKSKKPEISIELFPPKTPEGVEKLLGETIPRLNKLGPTYFSMTFGAGGTTRELTVELCGKLKNEAKVETMCHLNVIGQSKADTRENLKRIKESGVYNLLALRGDPPKDQPDFKPHPDGFHSSLELIQEAAKDPWFSIAVTGFPEVHPEAKDRAWDIAYLKKKVEAGGVAVITQLFLDNSYFFELMSHVKEAGITAPIVPGILPILSVPQIRRFTKLCGSTIPPKVERELSKHENDDEAAAKYGIELATQLCEGLLKFGVPGLHFYALNRAPSTETILKNLNLA